MALVLDRDLVAGEFRVDAQELAGGNRRFQELEMLLHVVTVDVHLVVNN